MNAVDALYRWVARDTSPEVNEILGTALAHADPSYVDRIFGLLVERRHESAWGALVASFDRLTPPQQARVLARRELVRAGLSLALRARAPGARHTALRLAAEHPAPALAYEVCAALREDGETRALAATALVRLAEHVLEAPPGQVTEQERGVLLGAVREALRQHARHGHMEVLQVGLWFAPELEEALWPVLEDAHGRCGLLVSHQLKSWNSPRLAGFLLLALTRPALRQRAQEFLNTWREHAEITALLRCSALLERAAVARELAKWRRPAWMLAAIAQPERLPPALQAELPRWVCRLSFSMLERLRCLEHWQHVGRSELQRAATYALASLGTPEADAALARLAGTRHGLAQFARWHVLGRRLLRDTPATAAPAVAGNGRGVQRGLP